MHMLAPMDKIGNFLAMGGLCRLVWPAFCGSRGPGKLGRSWRPCAACTGAKQPWPNWKNRGVQNDPQAPAVHLRPDRRSDAVSGNGAGVFAFNKNIVFSTVPPICWPSPSRWSGFRLGGLVEQGSVAKDGTTIAFASPTRRTIAGGPIAAFCRLFREGQAWWRSSLASDGSFTASSVLASMTRNTCPRGRRAFEEERGMGAPPTPDGHKMIVDDISLW